MFRISSPAFSHEGTFPAPQVPDTCGGSDNNSPPLTFENAPEGTLSYVVIAEDPDAPSGTFTHWVAYDIPASQDTLPEGIAKDGTTDGFMQGRNDFGNLGYDGPCPPAGDTHRYFFHVYALDIGGLNIGPGATADQVRDQIEGHVSGQSEYMGRYGQ